MWWGRLVMMGAAAGLTAPTMAQSAPVSEQPTPSHETVVVRGAPFCLSKPDAKGTRNLSFDCLNAELKEGAEVEAQVPGFKAADAAGRGNPEKLGTFSYTATQIRMGSNFGKSVKPERPPAPSTANVLLPAGGK
jgi:hypothetical protein